MEKFFEGVLKLFSTFVLTFGGVVALGMILIGLILGLLFG